MTSGSEPRVPWEPLIDAMAGLEALAGLIHDFPAQFTPADRAALRQLQGTTKRIHDTHPDDYP